MFQFQLKSKKYIPLYKLLASSTEDICQIICKWGFKEKAFNEERHYISLIVIFSYLCYYIKNYYLKKYSSNKSETVCKYMGYQLALRFDDATTEYIASCRSNVITKLSAYQKMHDEKNPELFADNIYEDASQMLIAEVCFYDTYFYNIDTEMIKEIAAIMVEFESKVEVLSIK